MEPLTRLSDALVRYAADLDASVADAHGQPAATWRRVRARADKLGTAGAGLAVPQQPSLEG
ncbi:hypothetical protein [Kitasatospora sp. NPDC001132]